MARRKEKRSEQLKHHDRTDGAPYPAAASASSREPAGGSSETSSPTEGVYTPAEAAEVLKVPESWLRKKAAARTVPCTFIGKHLRFTDADLSQILREGARTPVAGKRSRNRRSPNR